MTLARDLGSDVSAEGTRQFITLSIADQLFGIPVLDVHEVLTAQRLTPVPLARPEIAGSLNLRGRIVTGIDVRRALGLPSYEKPGMYVVVENKDDLYSLIVDTVGEVMDLQESDFERPPATLDSTLREVAGGIYRLEGDLLVVLDVDRLLDFDHVGNGI